MLRISLLLVIFVAVVNRQCPVDLLGGKTSLLQKTRLSRALSNICRPAGAEALGAGLPRAVDPARVRGIHVLPGRVFVYTALDELVELSAFELFYSEKKLLGSFYGSGDVRTDFLRLLRMWKAGELDLEGMITRRIDLSEINDAFAAMLRGEVIRTVIDYN